MMVQQWTTSSPWTVSLRTGISRKCLKNHDFVLTFIIYLALYNDLSMYREYKKMI